MMDKIIELLKDNPKIYAWNIMSSKKESYQLFFIKQELDMNRKVSTKEYAINIFTFKEDKKKNKIGHSKFKVYSSMSEDEIKEKIEEQIKICEYSLNDFYTFPKKTTIKQINKEYAFGSQNIKDAAFIAADALFEADKFDKGYINSSEIFINTDEVRFVDSKGNDFHFTNQNGIIELVTSWNEKNEEIELYKCFEFDHLDTNFIQRQANELLLEASNRIKAIPTPSLNGYKVLLTKEYVKDFFIHLANKAKTDSIYNRMSDFYVSYKLQDNNENVDLITLKLEPTMKNSTKSMPFDKEGIVLKKIVCIENGVVKNLWGSNAKSQYLQKPVYGTHSNYFVNIGTLTNEELVLENYIEIVSLSDFIIDSLTGDFAGEIRLAYMYSKSKEKTMITGGSISGNVYKSINSIRLFNESEQINNFIGPKSILLDNITFNKAK